MILFPRRQGNLALREMLKAAELCECLDACSRHFRSQHLLHGLDQRAHGHLEGDDLAWDASR
eukprot:9588372-Heterocapsa_arctica.AAC.1